MEMVGVDTFSMLESRPNQKEYIKLLDNYAGWRDVPEWQYGRYPG